MKTRLVYSTAIDDFADVIITAYLTLLLHNNSNMAIKQVRKQIAHYMRVVDSETKEKLHGVKSSRDMLKHIELIYDGLFN